MQNILTLLKNSLIVALSTFVCGFIGLFVGALIGGNFGFFDFLDTKGYEAAGLFFGILGLIVGLVAAIGWLMYKK